MGDLTRAREQRDSVYTIYLLSRASHDALGFALAISCSSRIVRTVAFRAMISFFFLLVFSLEIRGRYS